MQKKQYIYQEVAWHRKLFGMEEISSRKNLNVHFLPWLPFWDVDMVKAQRQCLNGQLWSLHIKKTVMKLWNDYWLTLAISSGGGLETGWEKPAVITWLKFNTWVKPLAIKLPCSGTTFQCRFWRQTPSLCLRVDLKLSFLIKPIVSACKLGFGISHDALSSSLSICTHSCLIHVSLMHDWLGFFPRVSVLSCLAGSDRWWFALLLWSCLTSTIIVIIIASSLLLSLLLLLLLLLNL